jgi:hypothetical protein
MEAFSNSRQQAENQLEGLAFLAVKVKRLFEEIKELFIVQKVAVNVLHD